MTKTGKILLISALSLAMAALVLYCVRFGSMPGEASAESPAVSAAAALQTAAQLSLSAEAAWLDASAQQITLADAGSAASASGVQVQENTVTITSAGVYRISGKLTDGQLAVDCDGTAALILDGVEIYNSADAAICVSDAAHALLYLPEGSTNKLISGTEQEITAASGNTDVESASGAAVYAKDDLSIAGSGSLSVGGYINNAVASTDHLTVLGGTLTLAAVNNALKGKDSVTVIDGTISIQSGNDGIKSDNDTDADCGSILILGGTIDITSLGDGIQAENALSISDGTITICAGDHYKNDREGWGSFEDLPGKMPYGANQGAFPGFGGGMGFPDNPGNGADPQGVAAPPETPAFGAGDKQNGEMPQDAGQQGDGKQNVGAPQPVDGRGQGGGMGDFRDRFDRDQSNGADDSASCKGLKSGRDLTVSGGTITVTTRDDAIHADGSIAVSGGTLLLSAGDDGFHADESLTISGGSITVSASYEGLEAPLIHITGGTSSVTSSDDGLNANGCPSDSDGAPLPTLKISGGTLYVNAEGDGLDSNGDLIIDGGNIIVDGPTSSADGALDSGSENGGHIVCNGGTVLAIGSAGMAEAFESDSGQCSFIQSYSGTMQAGTQITISDENGEVIFEYESAKSFSSIVFSSPELILGSTYTVTAGEQSDTITMEGMTNGSSFGFSMPGGFGGRDKNSN